MTNPNNAVGTNGAFSGRTSVNALNDVLAQFNGRGVLSGWKASPSSGLTVTIGGDGSVRDVAIAEDNAGNRTTVNNISNSPISVTMPAAPGVNSRVDAIVAYVKNPPQGSSTITDNYGACGLITASGTVAANPNKPTNNQIRTAITADGASGSTAYYVVLAYITISSGTTDIDASMIEDGSIATSNIPDGSVSADKLNFPTFGFGNYSNTEKKTGFTWTDGKDIYQKTFVFPALGTAGNAVTQNFSGTDTIVDFRGVMRKAGDSWCIPYVYATVSFESDKVSIRSVSSDLSTFSATITVFYTKS